MRGWGQALLGVSLLMLTACADLETSDAEPMHLLLISIDTLRADHLGSYGYGRETSPKLDALARESVRFTTALAPTPWTFPSHASMLTGMHPHELGIEHSSRTIAPEVPMLAEVLVENGYQTAAFVDSQSLGFVGAQRGFGRGFEHYAHAPHREGLPIRFDVEATVDAALDWLEDRDTRRPFFLFLHTKSVHAVPLDSECQDERCFPYDNPHRFRFVSSEEAPFDWVSPEEGAGQSYLWSQNAKIVSGELDPRSYPRERLDVLEALYDSGIYYVDLHLGRLLDALREQGLLDNTAVVVTSDHGEAFLDHFLFMHQEVYDELIRVPLLVRTPGGGGGRTLDEPVALMDIAPTLLELVNAEAPEMWTGRPLPLAPSDAGTATEPRDLLSYYLFPSKFTYQAFALRQGDWKLVVHNIEAPDRFRQELYNIRLDPGERDPVHDMDDRRDALVRALRRTLRQAPVAQGRSLRDDELPNLDSVRSLGYIE